jgi:hypothetical protein
VIVVDYLLRQSVDTLKSKGIDIMPNKTSREKDKYLTDLDYADDITLTATFLQDAQDLLCHLWKLLLQKMASFSMPRRDGTQLKEVKDFKYLGSYVADSRKDFQSRKAQAWKACNKLHTIWQSNISRKTKLAFFRACIESILLYGSETWTMKKDLQGRLDGTYTRLLMRVQNISWRVNINPKQTSKMLFDQSPPSLLNGVPDLQATAIAPRIKSFLMSSV